MNRLVRGLAAWMVALSLLGGMALPYNVDASVVDPDGACGPILNVDHLKLSFESPLAPPGPEHCVLCHWWNAMASASTAHAVQLATPADIHAHVLPASSLRADLQAGGHAAPRGPPSLG
jgi:hypothetical protein